MFNVLPLATWGNYETGRITLLFSGAHGDWKKVSLDSVKKSLKSELFPLQQSMCAYCCRPIFDEIGRVEIDHILPKNKYPNFTFERVNLVLTCKKCNHAKHEHDAYIGHLPLDSYPMSEFSFKWIHPYFHRYSDHISINHAGVYESVAGSLNGLAVIEKCKLDTIKRVEENREIVISKFMQEMYSSLTELVGKSTTLTSQEIATIFKAKTASEFADNDLIELIDAQRNPNLGVIVNLLKKLCA